MNGPLVLKWGGAALADAASVRRAARIIAGQKHLCLDTQLIVVVSAHQGVTDMLLAAAKDAEQGTVEIEAIRVRHRSLLSQLGLRSIEVAALELEDVRWAQGEILIRGKGSEGVLPLPQEVGAALVAYLKESRPRSTSRRIFLQIRAPHRDLTASGVRMVVGLACQRAGVPHIGSHKLRHTAATVMLRGGISLPDIAQVLRHRRVETTMIYAKVDDLALQGLARPWPGGEA